MALYRFLFAPVLLAVAVLTTSPRRAPQHAPPSRPQAVEAPAMAAPAHAPARESRVGPSRPGSVR